MNKIEVINLIKQTILMRKEAEDAFYEAGKIGYADSYRMQKEDLEWCLKLVEKLKISEVKT